MKEINSPMNISDKAKRNIYILWLLVVPFGTFLVYQYSPSMKIEWEQYFIYLILALLTTIFPFFVSGTTMFLVQWITVAVFLNYGILAELIIMQLSLIPIAYHMKVNRKNAHRMIYSSFMFFLISVICGSFVLLLGFNLSTLDVKEILLYGSIYAILTVILNHLFLYIRDRITGQNPKLLSVDFAWDLAGLLMTLPFGLSLYFLESYIGTSAFWLLGVPFITITLLVRLYNNSEKINADLTKASEFGHRMADRMTGKEIVDMFIERIAKMFPMDSAYIIDHLQDKFIVLRAIEDGENIELYFPHEDIANSLVGVDFNAGTPTLYNKQTEWVHIKPPFLTLEMQSVMSVPIYRNQRIEGVLVLASRNRHAFEAYQLKIVHLLCSYLAVSLEKAKYVKEALAKSELCELTKIYNYRYLDKQLILDMENLTIGKYHSLSLIMMDIDKFKAVNDQYGHHSGNLVLQAFAKIISNEIGTSGTVARYGGEEFVILLPNYSKQEAINTAEHLRRKIEQTPFVVQPDLDEVAREEIIFITASIGVSSAPGDSDDGMALLRNADRALYIGAKQAGRNRVAEYVK